MLFVLDGRLDTVGGRIGREQLGLFDRSGDRLRITAAETGAWAVLLGGRPIGEPVVFYGPFAMTSEAEIVQAIEDFNAGTFGRLD